MAATTHTLDPSPGEPYPYHLSRLPSPRMVALSEGNGSGTKLFQSLLDGHPQVLMIPGYPLMYFYPFWEKHIAANPALDWPQTLAALLRCFAPIFDSRINPGSEDLHRLGENQDQHLSVDITDFSAHFLRIVDNTPRSARNALLAFHYAYALAQGANPASYRVLVYHIHVFDYVKRYLFADFPDMLVLASVREPRANFSRREYNSIVKPNAIKFRASDATLMKLRAYRQIVRFQLNALDVLDCAPATCVRVFRHEDLALRLESVMRRTAEFLAIDYRESLLQPSFASIIWKSSFYDFDTSQVVNPEVLKEDWRSKEAPADILVIEALNCDYLAHYRYPPCVRFADDTASWLAAYGHILRSSRIERQRFGEVFSLAGWRDFGRQLRTEVANLHELTSYRDNLFYELKWTNDGIDFSRPRCHERWLHPGQPANWLARACYLASGYVRYATALLRTPWERALRIGYMVAALNRRRRGRRFLPEAL